MTRETVLKLAKPHFKVEERDLAFGELRQADEAFVTGTTKKMIPVVKVDDITIGKGKPGKNTQKLSLLFREFVDSYKAGQ